MKTIIEAGHYYQVHGPSVSSMKGWEIGTGLAASTEGAELLLFVDDYHQTQTFLEPGDAFLETTEAAKAAATLLDGAEHVFYEADLAKAAPQKMSELLDDGLVKEKKGVLSVGGVRLGCLRRLHYRVI